MMEDLQAYLDAKQDVDDLIYGIRSLKEQAFFSTKHLSVLHRRQVDRARETARKYLRGPVPMNSSTQGRLEKALRHAKEGLKEAAREEQLGMLDG